MSEPAKKVELGSSAPDRRVPVVAALASPSLSLVLKGICDELHDLSGLSPQDIVSVHGGGLIVVDQAVPGYDQVILQLAVDQPSSALIVISDNLPGHMVRALMKMDASDILPSSAGFGELLESAERLNETIEKQSEGSGSQCWAFRGAVGGAGVSTITIESAFALSRDVGPDRVCLVDLNVADGMITSFLEAVPKLDLEALSAAPERLDARLLAAWCWKHPDGVSILAAPRNPDADALATEEAILRLLDVTCNAFEYVIIDMPRHLMPWTKSVLAVVDQAIIISELTVPSLHAAADACRETDVLRGELNKTKLVLNRMFPKKRFRAEFAVEKAEQAIERDIDATIASDWDAARTAVNLGKSIAHVKEKSQLVSDIGTLVASLMPQDARSDSAKPAKLRRAK